MRCSHLCHINIFVYIVIVAAMLLIHLPADSFADDKLQGHQICGSPLSCANIQEMSYPFWGSIRPGYCGHPAFHLDCSRQIAEITILSLTYRVLEVNQSAHTLKVAPADDWTHLCPANLVNSTLDTAHFDYVFPSDYKILVLYYDCRRSNNPDADGISEFTCNSSQTRSARINYLAYPAYSNYTVPSCNESVVVHLSNYYADEFITFRTNPDSIASEINSGVDLEWKANNKLCDDCQASGGVCGYNSSSGGFICHCKDRSYPITCGSDFEGPYDEHYLNCRTTFHCASLYNVSYPFWGGTRSEYYCGHPDFKLDCTGPNPEIKIMSQKYEVREINQTGHTLRVAVEDFYDAYVCPRNSYPVPSNLSLSFIGSSFSDDSLDNQDVTFFYNCGISINAWAEITTSYYCNKTSDIFNFYAMDDLRDLKNHTTNNGTPLSDVIRTCTGSAVARISRSQLEGFFIFRFNETWLKWNPNHTRSRQCDDCQRSGGLCGYNSSSRDHFSCYCRDGPYPLTCASSSSSGSFSPSKHDHYMTGSSVKRNWAIGISATLSGIIVITILIIYGYKKESIFSKLVFLKKDESDGFNVEAFMETHGAFVPKRYTYANVRKMTNSFAERIGKGGYGYVYKGKLPDGSLVAVKVLQESKSNGEQFINEVASIGRTSHVNIVTLFGFCYERNKRALIYEYMPNGSLDKFIFNKEPEVNNNIRLEWKILYDIASGIARGLEYLHRGCSMRILHFDIKPHNILLDKDFSPKISDFGLAKLCRREDSIVSMLGARGTFGYVAPEVYCRNFGGVSYKSDVYSYGMMVLEMVGGRKNVDVGVSRTSKIYFPDWLYDHINRCGENLEIGEKVTNEDEEMVRKMILVSLWCIQPTPSDRPSMTKVVEMLEGSLESLQIPPKPSLSFPTT